MLKTFLLISALLFQFSAQASDQWYGTIGFSKTLDQETITPIENGEEKIYDHRTWSGTVRFLPGDKASISARYHEKRGMDRRASRTMNCYSGETAEWHDYQLVDSTTDLTVNREWNEKYFLFIINGKYSGLQFAIGGKHQNNVMKEIDYREIYNGCDKDPYEIHDQPGMNSNTMQSLTFKIKGLADDNAEEIHGTYDGVDEDGGHLVYEWNLTRKAPVIVAKITGDVSIERGQVVNLDGSSSIGQITSYEWEFYPEDDCITSEEGAMVTLTTPKVSFIALCNFTASLRVKDDEDNKSFTDHLVTVKPRKGEPWKTKYDSKVGSPISNGPMVEGAMQFGINQCSLHEGEEVTGHMIHSETPSTWKDSGYEVLQVSDGGPFTGAWYIKSQNLKVSRLERVNAKLLPGGSIYDLNQAQGNLSDVNSLAKQIKFHEATHSVLLKDYLATLGEDQDPAAQIEKLVGFDEETLQIFADMKIREVETELQQATADSKVKPRVKAAGFTKEVKLWIPSANEDGTSVLKQLGPLWNIGE